MKKACESRRAGAEAITVTTMATRLEAEAARILRILLVLVVGIPIVVMTWERVKVMKVATRGRKTRGVGTA